MTRVLIALAMLLLGTVAASAQATRTATCRIPAIDASLPSLQRIDVQVRRDGSCRVTLIGAIPGVGSADRPVTSTQGHMISFVVRIDTPPRTRRRVTPVAAARAIPAPRRQPPALQPRPSGPECFIFNGRRFCE